MFKALLSSIEDLVKIKKKGGDKKLFDNMCYMWTYIKKNETKLKGKIGIYDKLMVIFEKVHIPLNKLLFLTIK